MKPNIDNKHQISRKRFLQICGSVIAGGSILGMSGVLLRKAFILPDHTIPDRIRTAVKDRVTSPYRLVSSFHIPDRIEAFEQYGDKLITATANHISIYDREGSLLNNFAIASNLRDIAVDDHHIYLLFPTRIEVYHPNGEWHRDWEACSDQSDYCSFALSTDAVFVTDAANKNICKYTKEGHFVRFIESPNDFIIPSYSFGITYTDGILYCSNSGRHQIEGYTPDGEYVGAFGKAGGATGMFCGCCNPVHLTHTSTGEIITSEKGNPRISCYGSNGEFRNILLDSKALGGGHTAYDIKVQDDKLFVAGIHTISTFQYDKALAIQTSCSDCAVDCPLRKGVSI